jgi:hypothetical protein
LQGGGEEGATPLPPNLASPGAAFRGFGAHLGRVTT